MDDSGIGLSGVYLDRAIDGITGWESLAIIEVVYLNDVAPKTVRMFAWLELRASY